MVQLNRNSFDIDVLITTGSCCGYHSGLQTESLFAFAFVSNTGAPDSFYLSPESSLTKFLPMVVGALKMTREILSLRFLAHALLQEKHLERTNLVTLLAYHCSSDWVCQWKLEDLV
jgi:hypothetical protein